MSAKSLNVVMLIGNVTRDPELRYTPQGNAVATFGLATNRSWKTDSGEIREEAEFHRLVAWNKLAELCTQLCTKGRKIYVQGRLQTRTFTGSDNAQHTITEIVIDDMILLDSRMGTAPYVPGPRPEPTAAVAEESASGQSPNIAAPAPVSRPPKIKKTSKTQAAAESSPEPEPAQPAEGAKAPTGSEDINSDDIPF